MKLHHLIATAALLTASTTFAAIIPADPADQFAGSTSKGAIDGGDSVGNATGTTLKVGSVAAGGRSTVYVFKLPDLGPLAAPFADANLTFKTQLIDDNTVNANRVDLYGLSRRDAAPAVLAEDHFTGALDATNATLVQNNILTNSSPENALIDTDATGDTALLAFLNAQYAAGAGIGQYVYLRLNTDAGTSLNATGYNVYTANSAGNEPFITYTVVPEPASLSLLALAAAGLARRRASR